MSGFNLRLRNLREELGLSQHQIANIIGVSKSAISMYENGNREPDFYTLHKFTEIFGVDFNYLMSDDSSVKPIGYMELRRFIMKSEIDEKNRIELIKLLAS